MYYIREYYLYVNAMNYNAETIQEDPKEGFTRSRVDVTLQEPDDQGP